AAIGHRLAAGHAAVGQNVDEQRLGGGHQVGLEGQRNGDHVVHREADETEELAPDVDIDREHVGDHVDDGVVPGGRLHVGNVVARQHGGGDAVVLADVQRHEDLLHVGIEHDARGFRV